jgi:ADP-ribose pyrophosphatase
MKSWNLLDASLSFSAPPWLEVFREKVELPGGRVIDDFYRVVTPEFAVVVAVTPDKHFLMVRGYKHGPRRVCLSTPAGLIEPGESPLEAAQRELLEETGYATTDWCALGAFVVDSNRQCGTAHLFLARDVVQVALAREDETEELQVESMSPQQFLDTMRKGDIVTLATVASIALSITSGLI